MDFLGVAVESWSFRVNLCWTVWIKTSHVQAKCWRSDYTGGNLIVIIVWPILRKKSLPKTWVNFRKSWPFLFLVCFRYPSGAFLTSIPGFTLFSREIIERKCTSRKWTICSDIEQMIFTKQFWCTLGRFSNDREILWHEHEQSNKRTRSNQWRKARLNFGRF